MRDPIKSDSYGMLLKHWRKQRGVIQGDLALECDTSTRHLSCIETERAQPSRHLLLRLCRALDIPPRACNSILISAGYAPLYHQTGLSDPEMTEARQLLETILKANEPYPTMLLDQNMDIIMHNGGFNRLIQHFANEPEMLDQDNLNLLQLIFSEGGFRQYLTNLEEVYHTMMERARRTLLTGAPDHRLRKVMSEMYQLAPADMPEQSSSLAQIVMPLHLSRNGVELKLSTTSATLGSSLNITLQELFIETAYPLGESSQKVFDQLFAQA